MSTADATVLPVRPGRSLVDLVALEKKRARRRHEKLWALLLAVPVLGAASWLALRPRPVPLVEQYRTQAITEGEVVREVRATGHVEAVTTVQVGAEISGRIATVEVDYNDRVKHGQVLAQFDRATLAAQLAQTDATLASARASLEQTRTDRERSGRDLTRSSRLHDQKVIGDAEHEVAVANASLALQRVSAAEAQVAAQRALFTVSKTALDHTIIRSPIDGIVITRNVDPGQTVASVMQTPVLFTVAADLRKMRVIAAVDEADIGEVAVDQKATFTVSAYPDRVFAGVVTEVRSSPVVVQDVVTYGTVIEVENLDLALKPGMTASARIRTATATHVLRVPATALRFTPPGERNGDRPGAWRITDGSVHRVELEPGITDGETTAFAAGTLSAGDVVLLELSPKGRKVHGVTR